MPNVRAMRLRMRGVPMMWDMPGILAALLDGARSPRPSMSRRCAVVLLAAALLGGCGEVTGTASTQPPTQAGNPMSSPVTAHPTPTVDSIPSPVAAEPTPTVDLAESCNVSSGGAIVQLGTLDELAWASHQIVVGTVVEILPPVWGAVLNPGYSNYRPIYTDYVVQVEQRLRGTPVERVRVRQVGGTIDGRTQESGDTVPMAVADAEEPTYFLAGVGQGFWQVRDDDTVVPFAAHYNQHAARTIAEIRHVVAEALSSDPPKPMPVPAVSLDAAPLAPAE